ncbi:MAG: hypothetical protein J6C37_04435 [Roseburia sp.]|nr:hypothetical protein [Roseburia sp.]
MKRKIYVPVMLSSITVENRKEYLSALREMQTDCLFLSPERDYMFETDTRIRQQAVADLKGHMAYFTSHGLEVGIWIQAFGFGIPLTPSQKERTRGMTKIKSVTGREAGDAFCPENSAYMDMYCEWTKELASLKPAYFMLDDDLCLSVRPGLGCFCERHIRLLEEKNRTCDDKR